MTRTVRILRRAEEDLRQVHASVRREVPLRADPFINALIAAIESLDELAERGARPRDPTLRRQGYRFLVHGAYLIFYKVLPRTVRVYRVLHGQRAYRGLL